MNNKNVAIVGASSNIERFSNKAMKLLTQYGYTCFLVNPKEKFIDGIKVYASLSDIKASIDTVTLYLSEKNQEGLFEQIANTECHRVIFNPGTENTELESSLKNIEINVKRACTLIMLETNTF